MGRKGRRFGMAVAATAIAATATASNATADTAATGHAAPPVDVAAADNAFGFRLLRALQKKAPGANVVLSPVSAALDLAMALNGATGATREQMLTALSLSGNDIGAINTANTQLIKVIRTPASNVTLSVADSLWVDNRRATFRPDYVKRVQEAYDAEIDALDFSDPAATGRINGWASKQTHERIPKVIDRIDPADLALLLNAVYFKGQWTHKFDKALTQQRDFNLAAKSSGSVKQVARMAQSGHFDYFDTPDLQAIRLPFGTGDLVMEVLLPAKSSSLSALEAELTPEHWAAWRSRFTARAGRIELPRFELQSSYHLNEPLQALGMVRAFHANGPDEAQLTEMLSPQPGHPGHFFISSVLQSTYWKVDEEGSEAAAVTTIGVRAALMRPEEPFQMIVDRPFFGAIEDRRSGALLFVGAIYDPTGG
jgi:serine protease inhibitor